MRVTRSHVLRSTAILIACSLGPGCSSDSTSPASPVDPEPAPTSGALELTIRESGARPDPDGYEVTITLATQSGAVSGTFEPGGGTILLSELPIGVHTLRVEGLAENCTVSGRHPRAFAVLAGITNQLEVVVFCPGPGAVLVKTVTGGRDLSAAGYKVSIEGESAMRATIGANDSLLIAEEDLPEGTQWSLALTDVPENCWVNRPRERVGSLRGETVRVEYTVACIPRTSRIAYLLKGEVLVTGGADAVSLGTSASLGRSLGPSLSPDRSRVVLSAGADPTFGPIDLYLVGVGGGGGTAVSTSDEAISLVGSQAWSPDGSRIVYSKSTDSGTDIYVVNADGRGEVRLTRSGFSPAWSPDGSTIAFCRWEGEDVDATIAIYRMSAIDGSGLVKVVDHGCHPAWSPDGTRLAYTTWEPFDSPDLAVIRVDGSAFTRLHPGSGMSTQTGFYPTWSPDGSLIAYVGGTTGNRIWIVEFDGSGFGEPFPFHFGTAPSWR